MKQESTEYSVVAKELQECYNGEGTHKCFPYPIGFDSRTGVSNSRLTPGPGSASGEI